MGIDRVTQKKPRKSSSGDEPAGWCMIYRIARAGGIRVSSRWEIKNSPAISDEGVQ